MNSILNRQKNTGSDDFWLPGGVLDKCHRAA
jgi:hypothetical protein